ncbi:MAG: pyruvate kinase [Vampirovibrionales bacterium]
MTRRLTKIVSTLGPASRHAEGIETLIKAGANVFRFNYSHAEYEKLTVAYGDVRRISKELGMPVGILSDLQGPKFRVGFFEEGEGVQLVQGETVEFAYSTEKGNAQRLHCNVKELVGALHVGTILLLDDGNIELTVLERKSEEVVVCRVENSAFLKERKGVNVPSIRIPVPAMTEKDKHDAEFALKMGTDFIALSFVQCADDVRELREFMEARGFDRATGPKIVVKMEKPQALEALDEILAEADVLMVARGDLGVELKPEQVPVAQKNMIRACINAGKPVITATQMMESMISNPVPTRAEVSDMANAIFDGTDAVMTSAETASGKYPEKTVNMMTRIAIENEKFVDTFRHVYSACEECDNIAAETVAESAVDSAAVASAKAIVCYSLSGSMARRISKFRPSVPVIALTTNEDVMHQLCVSYAVYPMLFTAKTNTDETLAAIKAMLLEQGHLSAGDTIVLASGATELAGLNYTVQLATL